MAKHKTADQALVREMNLSLVLRHIHNEGPVSRAQIAKRTGLNKSTVSSLVEDLFKRRLVHETGFNSVGTGRPATMLEINPRCGGIVGAELGVDFVAVVLTDFTGNILWRNTLPADPQDAPQKMLTQILEMIKEAIVICKEQELYLLGIGISAPGTVDLDKGVLIYAPNLQWRDIQLRKFISDPTGARVFIENDANAAAIAEHLFGTTRQNQDFIFIFAGIGIGGGLYLNGKLHRGKNGFAGEIGHTPITAVLVQTPCHCGNNGCWETLANFKSIIRRVQVRMEEKQDSIIPRLMKEQNASLSISIIQQAADACDTMAKEALADTGEAMGLGFASLINILNPEKIILGGPISCVGQYLLPSIKDVAIKHSLSEIGSDVDILLSSFATDASLIGAVSLVADDILSNPTHVEKRLKDVAA